MTRPAASLLTGLLQYLARLIVVGALYYVTARLVLTISIPPSFATPIWPPAGIALAALLCCGYSMWPAIFLASLTMNLPSYGLVPNGWAVATCIAAGAALQACTSALMIRQVTRLSLALEQVRDILSVLVLGGLVGCLISATVATTTFYMADIVSANNFFASWMTWWLGDSIGVTIFTPIALILSAPRVAVSYPRKFIMSGVLICIFAVNLYLFYSAHDIERQARRADFESVAERIAEGMRLNIQSLLDLTGYTEGLYIASDEVTSADFNRFTRRALNRHSEIRAIVWLPYITHNNRAAFEKFMRSYGHPGFVITEYDEKQRIVAAGGRDFYLPIMQVEPAYTYAWAYGLDIAGPAMPNAHILQRSIKDAWRSGQAQLTPTITMPPRAGRVLLIFRPLYKPQDNDKPPEQRQLQGMVSLAFLVDHLMVRWSHILDENNMRLTVADYTESAAGQVIYETRTDQDLNNRVRADSKGVAALDLTRSIEIGGRRWQLYFSENPATERDSWILSAILISGMLFTTILVAFLLLVMGRTQEAQRLVEKKTHEVVEGRASLQLANQEINRQHRIVQEKEETFRLAMENASIGMALVLPDGKFLSVNQALCDIVGYSADELHKLTFQKITHPDDVERDVGNARAILQGEVQNYRLEKRYIHKQGHEVWVLLSVSLVRNPDGAPRYFIAQIHDITELKQNEFDRQKLIDQLIESNAELEKFAYVASHDMQEPLRMMASFSDLLVREQGQVLDEDGRQYLKMITDSAIRMQDMVSGLLEFARLSRSADHIEKVDSEEVLSRILDNLASAIQRSGAQITHDPLPQVRAEAIPFGSLLQNLISNAIKYQMPGNQPHIHISASRTGAFWEFVIRDNGIGISEADFQRIFEPFTRLHPWQQYQGTGIGLAICRKIIEGMGGRIWVTSVRGKGSEFHFTIPAEP